MNIIIFGFLLFALIYGFLWLMANAKSETFSTFFRLSTIITAIVLYWFGSNFSTSVMQGFALTLGLGVLLSMITSFQVNRILVRLITSSNLFEQSNLFIPISKKNKSGDN